ncbi:hypothetical protein BDB00DRAFT_791067 [Zychaea mexicana]|uniref:uncharacterized protein n=1 Tax=Zychaea mexicana TaxID=64656 RepID=UPI0022FE7020|nr:uncharacterized protein BDB00DRAFT_791067 [Zychaea mexicana]KAI9489467.1 hypothetical protein BDB00DRAFT_791067 [Zychaea mexicana]
MLSPAARRTMISRMATTYSGSNSVPASYRCYTLIPSTPQQGPQAQAQPMISREEDHPNPIHALYNTENQSMLDASTAHAASGSHSAPQHDAASDVFGSSADTFSPTFNTVFDE